MNGIKELDSLVGDTVRAYVETESGSGKYREEVRYIKYRLGGGTIDLKEDDESASLRLVHLTNLDARGLALKPDNFGVRFFKANSWNKAVDYLILTSCGSQCFAIFIDLKSSINDKPDSNDNLLVIDSKEDRKKENQFRGAEALFAYLRMLLEREFGVAGMAQYQIKKWILYEKIKPRSGIQSPAMSIAHRRAKSQDVHTKQVVDGQTINVAELL